MEQTQMLNEPSKQTKMVAEPKKKEAAPKLVRMKANFAIQVQDLEGKIVSVAKDETFETTDELAKQYEKPIQWHYEFSGERSAEEPPKKIRAFRV